MRRSPIVNPMEADIVDHERVGTLFTGESRVLELIARGAPLGETLNALCGLVQQVSREWLAAVLLLDHAADRVWHGAAPTLPQGYLSAIDGIRAVPTYGPCGLAAQGHQVVA